MLATIWLTDSCNLDCIYCFEGEKGSSFMDKATAVLAVDFLLEHAKVNNLQDININFYGGEPLLNFPIARYIAERLTEKCRENNLRIGFMLTTNGTIFNDEIAKFIEKFRPSISISIDGPESVHNKNRKQLNGQGSFSKASATGLLLQAMPIVLFARLTYNAQTVDYLSDSIEYLINQGYKIVKPVPDYCSEWDDSALERLELQLLNIDNLQDKYPEADITILKPYMKPRKKLPCQGAGIYEVNILPDGSLYPCTQVAGISKFKIGDVANGIDKPTLIQQHKDSVAITRNACQDCKYSDYCDSGRCTYVNYRMTGRIDMASDSYCRINRVLFSTAEKVLGSMCNVGERRYVR